MGEIELASRGRFDNVLLYIYIKIRRFKFVLLFKKTVIFAIEFSSQDPHLSLTWYKFTHYY